MHETDSSTSLRTVSSGLTGFEAQVLASIDLGEATALLQDLRRAYR